MSGLYRSCRLMEFVGSPRVLQDVHTNNVSSAQAPSSRLSADSLQVQTSTDFADLITVKSLHQNVTWSMSARNNIHSHHDPEIWRSTGCRGNQDAFYYCCLQACLMVLILALQSLALADFIWLQWTHHSTHQWRPRGLSRKFRGWTLGFSLSVKQCTSYKTGSDKWWCVMKSCISQSVSATWFLLGELHQALDRAHMKWDIAVCIQVDDQQREAFYFGR